MADDITGRQLRRWTQPLNAAQTLTCFSVAVFSLSVLPRMMSYMFLDGVHFAAVARNMAENVGTFWKPYYTATFYPVEHDHPPLGFWLQSLAFRLFGESPWVESLYGYGVGLLILWLLAVLWNRIRRTETEVPHAWCVLLLFCLPPVVSHAMAANLLEPVMTVFVLIAAILTYDALRADSLRLAAVVGLAAGASIVAAILVKGPVGGFVATMPLCALATSGWVSRRVTAVTQAAVLGGVLLTGGGLVLASGGAWEFVVDHVSTQIVPSLTGLRERQSRGHLIAVLLGELGTPLLVCVAASFLLRVRPSLANRESCALFLLLGLAGSLPFIISPKQPRRYLIPSFPFFVIAMSLQFRHLAIRIEERVRESARLRRGILVASSVIMIGTVGALLLGRGMIKDEFQTDFGKLSSTPMPRTLIEVCPALLRQEWGLHANFQRTFKMSLTTDRHQPYYLRSVDAGCELPRSCTELLNEGAQTYELYRCKRRR